MGWSEPRTPDAGYPNGNRRLYVVPDDAPAADYPATAPRTSENLGDQFPRQPASDLAGPDWRETTGFQRQPGPARREAVGYQRQPGPARRDAPGHQRQTGPGWQETADYRREAGSLGPGPGPATGRFRDGHSPNGDSHWAAGQVLTRPDDQAAQITQAAQENAAAIREAAEREAAAITQQATDQAAAIREAAEREAVELRARLDSMSGELGRLAAYVTETLGDPAKPANGPAMLATAPAMPAPAPALPRTRPAQPRTTPARPDTSPRTRPAGPDRPRPDAAPGTRPKPTGPGTTPGKPERRTRQQRAARIATAGTAALLSVAAVGAVTMTSIHGFSFFVFRESAQGETPGNFTDANFLAGQKECSGAVVCPAPPHHDSVPKGRHHKATGSKESPNK
jgi:hypothetical protein